MKFSVAFLLVGLIPLILLSVFSLRTFTGYVERFTIGNLEQMSQYSSYNVNNVISDYDEITKLMYTGRYEGYSRELSRNQTANVNERERINDVPIDAFLRMVLSSDKRIQSAYFVRESDGKLYTQSRLSTAFRPEHFPVGEWRDKLSVRPNRLLVEPVHGMDYYRMPEQAVLTFGRNLIDISGNLTARPKVVGSLLIDVDASVLNEVFQGLSLSAHDELYVLNEEGRIYYSNREEAGKKSGDVYEKASEDSDYMTLSEAVPNLSGELLIRLSREQLFSQLNATQSGIYVAIVISAVVLLVMGAIFSRRLASPIRVVLQHMNKIEMGNLDTQIKRYGKDEIGRLAFGFNRMVERLRLFINDAYVAEIKRKQAELNVLKSQIRPHYLYNTLEVIRMNAVYNDDGEVADLILALSNQLKYVIDYGEDWVRIEDELEHLRDYIAIIRARFENRIDLKIKIADGIKLDQLMLKLTVQPLVENAVQHGIRPNGGKGSVLVSLEHVDGMLCVTVYDDGVGMDEHELRALRLKLAEEKSPSKNVGMKNVHERIRTICGERYGLEVSSVSRVGTSVKLLLPIKEA